MYSYLSLSEKEYCCIRAFLHCSKFSLSFFKLYIVQNHFDCPETRLENRQHCLKNDLNLLYKKTYLSCLYLNLLILKKLHLVIQRLYANNGFNLRAHSYKRAFNNLWSLEDARVEKSRKELQEVLCKNGQQYLRQD